MEEEDNVQLYESVIVQPLYHLFQCNIQLIPSAILLNDFLRKKSPNLPLQPFLRCIADNIPYCRPIYLDHQCNTDIFQEKDPQLLHDCYLSLFGELDLVKPKMWNQTTWETIVKPSIIHFRHCTANRLPIVKQCAEILRKACLQASLRSVKEIRLDFRLVAPLLRLDPEIKVVHLVRDPRGLLASCWSPKVVSFLCSRMLKDLNALQHIQKQFPGCCLQIRYEDLTTNPAYTARKVFEHVGVDFEKYYKNWLLKINNSDEGSEGIYRSNMTAEGYDWRHKVPKESQQKILNITDCAAVIDLLNY